MQPALGWRAWRGAAPGRGWQELCAVPTPGCDLLTTCAPGWLQQGLPLSPEDLLPFNPLFQDEILIAGASVQPGQHGEGMGERRPSAGGHRPQCWPPLSSCCLQCLVPPIPGCPALFTPVGRTSVFPAGGPCQPRGRARSFQLCRSRGFGSSGSCPGAGKAQSLMCPPRLQLGLLEDVPGAIPAARMLFPSSWSPAACLLACRGTGGVTDP